MIVPPCIADALSSMHGAPVQIRSARSAGGGCINQTALIETSAGTYFAKWNDAPPRALFEREALGLAALARSCDLCVPDVVAVGAGFIILELLEPGPRSRDFEERLGRGLAALHRTTRPTFGFDADTYCGTTLQPNPATLSWIEFYRDHRLGHQLGLLRESGLLGPKEAALFDRLLARLGDHLDDGEPPALIHGDLWSGNVFESDAGPALIDPACAYANREAELGMMTLFGGFGPRVYDAYEEDFPLREGWRERNPLYRLYHVANHANLFGGSYVAETMRIVERYA
jgi:fructosamine-3-kinase